MSAEGPDIGFVFHPLYHLRHAAPARLPSGKAGVLFDMARAAGLVPEDAVVQPAPAPVGWLTLVHRPDYVLRALSCRLDARERRLLGIPLSPAYVERARVSAGGTVLAARLALECGLAFHFAGGGHHAGPDGPGAYCLFNDVAVAAAVLLAEGSVRRVLVLDLDVHQGDGTARIFAHDPRVFTLSLHARDNYPARKARSRLDLALPDGLDGPAYLAALRTLLPPLLDRLHPDLALVIAGVDVHADDPLGRLSLSEADIAAREELVARTLLERGIPAAFVPGGGYGPRDVVARRHLAGLSGILRALASQRAS